MADPDVRDASQRAARERQRKLDEGNPEQKGNHPGSRFGTAAEDRPDLAPEMEPVVVPDVSPEDVPEMNFSGALPENAGEDPGDTHRGEGGRGPLGKPGRRP